MKLKQVTKRSDILECLLCENAPCEQACPRQLPAKMLRSVWFNNEECAAAKLPEDNPCANCQGECEKACVQSGRVPIKETMMKLQEEVKTQLDIPEPDDMNRLRTSLCGIPLENPFLLSSSVVASNYEMCARAFEAGWAGAAFKTICNFDIHEASPRFASVTGDNGSVIGFKNIEQLSDHSVEENMKYFRQLKEKYPSKVILASIMGRNEEEWGYLAKKCEENGADAVELNFSCPNMEEGGLGSDIGLVPELVERFTRAAKRSVDIPVLAKLTPNVSEMSSAAEAAKRGGADGIAAINTIKSVMGINRHTYVSSPEVKGCSAVGGYSGRAVKPIALRFISEMGRNPKLDGMHLSGMGGIETWMDALEFMLLGCGTVQVTTAVMQYGYRIIDELKAGLNYYLAEKGVEHIGDMVGQGLDSVSDSTDVLERDSIVYPKFHRDECVGCGRCYVSCRDGGHQAISFGEDRKPYLDPKKCVGCHLCVLVCPKGAITSSNRRIKK